MGVWQGVAMNSLQFHSGPPCSTLLRPTGGPPLKRPYSRFSGGPPLWTPHAVRLWQYGTPNTTYESAATMQAVTPNLPDMLGRGICWVLSKSGLSETLKLPYQICIFKNGHMYTLDHDMRHLEQNASVWATAWKQYLYYYEIGKQIL
jgi:hypothetical protein